MDAFTEKGQEGCQANSASERPLDYDSIFKSIMDHKGLPAVAVPAEQAQLKHSQDGSDLSTVFQESMPGGLSDQLRHSASGLDRFLRDLPLPAMENDASWSMPGAQLDFPRLAVSPLGGIATNNFHMSFNDLPFEERPPVATMVVTSQSPPPLFSAEQAWELPGESTSRKRRRKGEVPPKLAAILANEKSDSLEEVQDVYAAQELAGAAFTRDGAQETMGLGNPSTNVEERRDRNREAARRVREKRQQAILSLRSEVGSLASQNNSLVTHLKALMEKLDRVNRDNTTMQELLKCLDIPETAQKGHAALERLISAKTALSGQPNTQMEASWFPPHERLDMAVDTQASPAVFAGQWQCDQAQPTSGIPPSCPPVGVMTTPLLSSVRPLLGSPPDKYQTLLHRSLPASARDLEIQQPGNLPSALPAHFAPALCQPVFHGALPLSSCQDRQPIQMASSHLGSQLSEGEAALVQLFNRPSSGPVLDLAIQPSSNQSTRGQGQPGLLRGPPGAVGVLPGVEAPAGAVLMASEEAQLRDVTIGLSSSALHEGTLLPPRAPVGPVADQQESCGGVKPVQVASANSQRVAIGCTADLQPGKPVLAGRHPSAPALQHPLLAPVLGAAQASLRPPAGEQQLQRGQMLPPPSRITHSSVLANPPAAHALPCGPGMLLKADEKSWARPKSHLIGPAMLVQRSSNRLEVTATCSTPM